MYVGCSASFNLKFLWLLSTHQDNFIVTSLTRNINSHDRVTRNLKLFIQHTSSTEIVTTQTLICLICFGSNVEKDELKVHPVDSLAIINNIWYSAKPSNTADINTKCPQSYISECITELCSRLETC